MERDDIINSKQVNAYYSAGDGANVAIFSQLGISSFQSYVAKLEKEGYRPYTSTRFDGDGAQNVNAFATYESDTYTVDIGYHAADTRLYVTYTPKQEGFVLPPKEAPAFVPAGKDYPTILTQLGTERFHRTAVAMCYVLRAADGSFVIIDSAFQPESAELIYDVLKKQAPDPEHIVISAWIFTHPHWDHVGGFLDFSEKYAEGGDVTLRQIVCNFIAEERLPTHEAELQVATYEAARRFGDVSVIKVHAGNVLYYADLCFRVLYTQEDYLALSPTLGDSNAGSVVLQMETADGCKVLFGADHPVFGSWYGHPFCDRALYRWYGSFLQSDVVTTFHHGLGGGADTTVYSYVKPRIVLWPASWNRIYNDEYDRAYSHSLLELSCNLYFTDPEQAKANGVEGYYVSGDSIHVLHFEKGRASVTTYETADDYFQS